MTEVKLINLTPHAITVFGEGDEILAEIEASGEVLRLGERVLSTWEVNGIKVVDKELKAEGVKLPPKQKGVMYIVPLAVAQVARRSDFLVPDDLVRDYDGRVIGCRRFMRLWVGD